MRRLFLHVGPPKTGTSAVQHLFRTQPELAVRYPPIGLWADGAHHKLVFNFFGATTRPEAKSAEAAAMFEEIASLTAQDSRDLLVSAESLVSQDVGAFGRALLRHLGPGWEAEILFVCREHLEWAASLYNQSVKDPAMREQRLPGAYLSAVPQRFCLMPMLERMGDAGLKLRVLNYHPARDFVQRFLNAIGITQAREEPSDRRNISLGVPGLIAMLAANQHTANATEAMQCLQALRGMKGLFASAPMIFGHRALAAVAPFFAEDRARILERFGVELPQVDHASREDLFFLTEPDRDLLTARLRPLGPQAEPVIAALHRHLRPG